jgi:uncharacterized protein YfdQ (DUF2303 family)
MTEQREAEARVGAELSARYVAALREVTWLDGVPMVYERGADGQLLARPMAHLLPYKQRTAGTFAAETLDDFVAYVKEHGASRAEPERSQVYVDTHGGKSLSVAAVLDAFTCDGEPGWREHVATFEPRADQRWEAWVARCGKEMGQRDLANLIDERGHEITDPPAADLREIVLKFSAVKKVNVTQVVQEETSDVTFAYETETSGRVKGGDITLPKEITVAMAPFVGVEREPVQIKLDYGVGDAGLFFRMRIVNMSEIRERAVERLTERLSSELATFFVVRGAWR